MRPPGRGHLGTLPLETSLNGLLQFVLFAIARMVNNSSASAMSWASMASFTKRGKEGVPGCQEVIRAAQGRYSK